MGRNTQGVKLANLKENDQLVAIQKLEGNENVDESHAASEPLPMDEAIIEDEVLEDEIVEDDVLEDEIVEDDALDDQLEEEPDLNE